jgi:two-component system sensor histidine kinase RpfC
MSDLLNSTELSREQQELTKTLQSSASSLLSLIEDVLDISKIEAGRFSIEETDFDLHSLINKTISIMRAQAETKGLSLVSSFTAATPYRLVGDPHHLRQVFINLIGNAIKFTETGSVSLNVSTTNETGNSATIRFEVTDTGIGIPLEAQAQIFDSFTQADSSTTRKYGGTGLGTTISKQIVELMGGSIGIHSSEGSGSTFWFEIDFMKQQAANDIDSLDDLDSLRILVVSSNADERLGVYLDTWGVSYDVDDDPETALYKLANSEPANNYTSVILDYECIASHASDFGDYVKSSDSVPTILINPDNYIKQDHTYNFSYILDNPLNISSLYNALHAANVSVIDDKDVIDFRKYSSSALDRKLNILIAEDNKTNQMVITKIIERANHIPHIVGNGQQALDALENSTYDLVILDMQMPIMGGIEAAKIYSFMSGENKSPVIILTANATKEALMECENANVDAYLTKPIDIDKLLLTISRLTKNRKKFTCNNTAMSMGTPDYSGSSSGGSENAAASSLINYETLKDVGSLSDEKSFLYSLINDYIADTEILLSDMEAAITTKDYYLYSEKLHALKGSSGSIGAEVLYEMCSEVNNDIQTEVDYISHLRSVISVYNKTRSLLRQCMDASEGKHTFIS